MDAQLKLLQEHRLALEAGGLEGFGHIRTTEEGTSGR